MFCTDMHGPQSTTPMGPTQLDVGSTCNSLAFELLHPSIVCSIASATLCFFLCDCLLARVDL